MIFIVYIVKGSNPFGYLVNECGEWVNHKGQVSSKPDSATKEEMQKYPEYEPVARVVSG